VKYFVNIVYKYSFTKILQSCKTIPVVGEILATSRFLACDVTFTHLFLELILWSRYSVQDCARKGHSKNHFHKQRRSFYGREILASVRTDRITEWQWQGDWESVQYKLFQSQPRFSNNYLTMVFLWQSTLLILTINETLDFLSCRPLHLCSFPECFAKDFVVSEEDSW